MAERLTNVLAGRFLLAGALYVCHFASLATAQSATGGRLTPKVALGALGPPGCQVRTVSAPATVVASLSPRDAADSTRRLIATGQDAAVQGDHAAARDAFMLARSLSPTNARVAYYLGREYEDLGEHQDASKEYCRYLALVPTAPDADEVRGRVLRLTPPAEIARTDEARAQFRSGVTLLQQRQLVAADSAFGSVIRTLPTASEAYYNRALTRAARGERAAAMQDFERYIQLEPGGSDQAAIRSAMARLQDRVWNAKSVFFQGLIAPGVGQMATGRPIRGVFILAVGGGIAAAGLTNKTTLQTNEYRDPFGNPYIDSVQVTEHPYLLPAAGALAAVWLLSALEASAFARGSLTRARSILASSVDPRRTADGVSLVIRPQPHGRIGVGLSVRAGGG
jgi:tetratricopeptide (TPR) repeat protein